MTERRVAVILAGGKGTRLAPYTAIFPKPLVPLGQHPVVEILAQQLVAHGFNELIFLTGYLSELLRAYFHDHPLKKRGITFTWIKESSPLGTAAPLRLIDNLPEHFLVLNGDLFTTLNFSRLYDNHVSSGATLTIAMHCKKIKLQLGVVKHDGRKVTGYMEKPSYDYDVSMGIYAYSKKALGFIPKGEKMDFPDLVQILGNAGELVECEFSEAHWLDIGNPEDYAVAQEEFTADPSVYLREIE
ncbi:MAG: NTP transferase domain-containing protein [Candidatus Sabulitectum sp.]|nr:NTP transferase domain-containing protein [Candidatus Sabulitectum sp.]